MMAQEQEALLVQSPILRNPVRSRSRWIATVGIVLSLVTFVAYSDDAPRENLRTEISGIPWTPPKTNDKVIYGADDRIDVYAETIPARVAMAASTVALIPNSDLTDNGNGTYTISLSTYTIGGFPPCVGEAFSTQPTAAFCTGFMVGDDLIATAGHCIFDELDLATFSFVFGFDMLNVSTPAATVNDNQVYSGIDLLSHDPGGLTDHALVRVDRDITAPGAAPLAVRESGTIGNSAQVGVIGHPSGLPKKIAFGANTTVRDNSPADYFIANLDTYGGNSGSPVFNQITGEVEGILVRGASDYTFPGSCFASNVLADAQGNEDSTRISVILPFLDLITDQDQDLLDDDVETNTGTFVDANDTGTDPNNPDTDGDGYLDGIEVFVGTDPNDPFDFPTGLPLHSAAIWAIALGIAAVFIYTRRAA